MKPKRALALNFISALASVAGAILVILTADLASIEDLLLPFTAGAFVYIAGTDLIPELHKEPEIKRSLVQLIGLVAGIAIMTALLALE
jgi:zinc and cadmium transporter